MSLPPGERITKEEIMTNQATVADCSVTSCSYNHDGCNATAMNMGQNGCTTFIALDEKGGLPSVHAHVGACQKADCTFNDHLECVAEKIRVSAGECQTFKKVA